MFFCYVRQQGSKDSCFAQGTIFYSVASGQLSLSWPTNLGWILQAQSNGPIVGIGTNWVNVANSTSTNQVTIPVSTTNGSVFYRLVHP